MRFHGFFRVALSVHGPAFAAAIALCALVLLFAQAKAEDDAVAQNAGSDQADHRESEPSSAGADDFATLPKASNVNAVYHVRWLGTYIGDLQLRSSTSNRQYQMSAQANITLFFGAWSWQGRTSAKGLMTANGPAPQTYSFKYSAGERRENVELRFSQRTVQDISINPPYHPSARHIPITAAHLQNVVDPLSSSILLSQARLASHKENACNKRLPIFDGKIRYDLVLTPKGTRTVNAGKIHGLANVCSVRYVPIAGHKAGKPGSEDYATGNTGIEVWLVPMPQANLLVPYHISVPTPAGTATLTVTRFDVDTGVGRHALLD